MAVVPVIIATDHDHEELLVAGRLLTGQGCRRDASQGQAMLMRLESSRHGKVRLAAGRLRRAAERAGWFDEVTPGVDDVRLYVGEIERAIGRAKRTGRIVAVAGIAFIVVVIAVAIVAYVGGPDRDRHAPMMDAYPRSESPHQQDPFKVRPGGE